MLYVELVNHQLKKILFYKILFYTHLKQRVFKNFGVLSHIFLLLYFSMLQLILRDSYVYLGFYKNYWTNFCLLNKIP